MNKYVNLPNSCSVWEAMRWGEDFLQTHERLDAAIDAKLLMMHVLDWSQTKLLLERQQILQEDKKKQY